MKRTKSISFSRMFAMSLAFALLAGYGLTQILTGPTVLAKVPAQPLTHTARMSSIAQSVQAGTGGGAAMTFLTGVGGISFDAVAQPGAGLTVEGLELAYDPARDDGARLQLKINGQAVAASIPDWQLIPIARYADSPYYSCFTYFGSLKDASLDKTVKEKGGHILNYHPAFADTLLGLRLWKMDMLLFDDIGCYLYTAKETGPLGQGEGLYDRDRNEAAQGKLFALRDRIIAQAGQEFRSYVVCDYQSDIRFRILDGQLRIGGTPFYYCWNLNIADPEKEAAAIARKLDAELADKGDEESRKLYLLNQTIAAMRDLPEVDGDRQMKAQLALLESLSEERKKAELAGTGLDDLKQALTVLRLKISMRVVYLDELSRQISSKVDELRAANPQVWDAALATMRWAAFFRYCQASHSANWRAFIERIRNVAVVPEAVTPTVMYEKNAPGAAALDEALKDHLLATR